jgi:hypothetical protein
MLADLLLLIVLVITGAVCSTCIILDTLNKHAEQRKYEFHSVIIMIAVASFAICGCQASLSQAQAPPKPAARGVLPE